LLGCSPECVGAVRGDGGRRQAGQRGRHAYPSTRVGRFPNLRLVVGADELNLRPQNRRKELTRRFLIGAASLVLCLLALCSPQLFVPPAQVEPAPTASRGEPAPTPGQTQISPEAVPDPAVASPPLHITYPAVAMDQGVLPLTPSEEEKSIGSIVPPRTSDAYWLTPYGSPGPGSANTTYIVGHSWEGRDSPFNNISARSKPGDELTLTTARGILNYRVDAVTTEYKDTLKDSVIWAIVPGRLILITCYTSDLWGKNILVQASPMPAGYSFRP
jgi:hypothetical protein